MKITAGPEQWRIHEIGQPGCLVHAGYRETILSMIWID